eukprot:scaffold14459_cov66-Isochrysis_galbana.AAC.1
MAACCRSRRLLVGDGCSRRALETGARRNSAVIKLVGARPPRWCRLSGYREWRAFVICDLLAANAGMPAYFI